MVRNVVIIGSGPAGLTAAIYAARANLSPLVVEGTEAGGQLMLTTMVENYPAFPEGLEGPDLIKLTRSQAERFGTDFLRGDVTRVDLSRRPFTVFVFDQEPIETQTLIITSGASARLLGLPNEKKFIGHGASTCATCDGYFFRGKEVVVVGGGDSAMEEALFLTKFATKVTVVQSHSHQVRPIRSTAKSSPATAVRYIEPVCEPDSRRKTRPQSAQRSARRA